MADDSDGNGFTQDTVSASASALTLGGEKARQMGCSVNEL